MRLTWLVSGSAGEVAALTQQLAVLDWHELAETRSASWRSESGARPPKRVVIADDQFKADRAYRLACEGTAILWHGDFHNARQLLSALGRRVDRKARRPTAGSATLPFHQHRRERTRRARILNMVVIRVEPGCVIPLRRAPDMRDACLAAGCPDDEPFILSLRELLGINGAYEWRKKGVEVPALGARLHPYYGVFSPVRGEYVDLVAEAPLPPSSELVTSAVDVGTGTGVLAALLARRGVSRVVGTEQDERALACARDNITRLDLADRVDIVRADMFPPAAKFGLAVCNPPWIPAKPVSRLEHAVYDPGGRMLHDFLARLPEHLEPGGEGWLILSDLAEHLGLRTREDLLDRVRAAGLRVVDRLDATPTHPRASDPHDPLRAARAAETTSLWRLTPAPPSMVR